MKQIKEYFKLSAILTLILTNDCSKNVFKLVSFYDMAWAEANPKISFRLKANCPLDVILIHKATLARFPFLMKIYAQT